jgi:acetyl esterase/lipase
MISPEAEAFRTRVKHLMQATLQLEAPLATRRMQYETAMSRGHLPSHVQVEAVTVDSLVTNAAKDFMLSPDFLLQEAHAYLGEQDPRTPLASPVYADMHGFPPLLIQVGSDEVLLDDATRVAERARQAGVAVTLHIAEGMWHVWHAAAAVRLFPEGKAAFDQIADFVRR